MAREFATGIPSKETSHELPHLGRKATWHYAVHDHQADRRGRHFDLRLGDPETGRAHSWALPPSLPAPGQSTFAIQQPTHTVEYMDFEGTIPEGYGAGKVSLHARDRAEVTSSRPGHISFNLYKSTGPEEYTLHRLDGKQWKLLNRTTHRAKQPNLPDSKPKYKEIDVDQLDPHDGRVWSAKIDGAHNLFAFPAAGEQVRVVSYRPAKKSGTGIIEHTHKVPVIRDGLKTPEGLGGTICRGEMYALSPKTGKAIPAAQLAGLLNTNVWESREKQKQHGELIPALFDVVRYRGRDMADAPYAEKLKVLREVTEKLPHAFHLPRMATTPEDKKKLLADMKAGKIPETSEGIVAWDPHSGAAPTKAKFAKEHDVYIRDFFPGEGKYQGKGVGGFMFSHEPDGPIAGKVGTGLSDAQRHHMHQEPEKYMGMVARVKAHERFVSGALRNPSLQGWHLDKNEQTRLDLVKHASTDLELVFLWGGAIA